jgi:hypothetical protein
MQNSKHSMQNSKDRNNEAGLNKKTGACSKPPLNLLLKS